MDKASSVSFRLDPKELRSLKALQLELAAELGISKVTKPDAFRLLLKKHTEK